MGASGGTDKMSTLSTLTTIDPFKVIIFEPPNYLQYTMAAFLIIVGGGPFYTCDSIVVI